MLQPPAARAQSPSPTPFWNATTEARQNGLIADRCIRFLPLIRRWQPDFPTIAPELVLAVMAQESHCLTRPSGIDRVGSVGLMQVAPFPGRPSAEALADPALNVYWGMRILAGSIDLADGDVYTGLAFYNCGVEGVNEGRCGGYGGLAYADRILGTWLPLMARRLGKRVPMKTMTATPQPSPTSTTTPSPSATAAPTPTATPVKSVSGAGGEDLSSFALLIAAAGLIGLGAHEISRYLKRRNTK